jgi:hypothetical protein
MGEGRLRFDSELESALKLQCLKTTRASKSEVLSAFVLMYRDVGFAGSPPTSLEEMEKRRRDQDRDGLETMLAHLQNRGLNSDNFLVLQQPHLGCMHPNKFARDSLLESMRDLSRFIDSVCRTKRSPQFEWMHSVVNGVAAIIDHLQSASTIDITDTLRAICAFQAEEVMRSILSRAPREAIAGVGKILLRNFPFDNSINPRFAEDALVRFETQCKGFYEGLLHEIPEKVVSLRHNICEHLQAEWHKAWEGRRLALLDQLSKEIGIQADKFSREAANSAVNEVNGLSLQTALDCVSADPYCERAVAAGLKQLTMAAERLHPKCAVLIVDRFGVLKANLEHAVRIAIDPHWRKKKQEAQTWQSAEKDKAYRAQLQAETERHRQETIKLQKETKRREEEEQQRLRALEAEREQNRKRERPQSLTEMKETNSLREDPIGDVVWLYPGGSGGLKFRILSLSPRDTRLELAVPSSMRIRKTQVARTTSVCQWNTNVSVITWTETRGLGDIPFYFDGDTMGIVFKDTVTLGDGEAIYIDMPDDTRVENLPGCGSYRMWFQPYDWTDDWKIYKFDMPPACPSPPHAHLGNPGTYNRGPRLQSDHA